VSSAFDR